MTETQYRLNEALEIWGEYDSTQANFDDMRKRYFANTKTAWGIEHGAAELYRDRNPLWHQQVKIIGLMKALFDGACIASGEKMPTQSKAKSEIISRDRWDNILKIDPKNESASSGDLRYQRLRFSFPDIYKKRGRPSDKGLILPYFKKIKPNILKAESMPSKSKVAREIIELIEIEQPRKIPTQRTVENNIGKEYEQLKIEFLERKK